MIYLFIVFLAKFLVEKFVHCITSILSKSKLSLLAAKKSLTFGVGKNFFKYCLIKYKSWSYNQS